MRITELFRRHSADIFAYAASRVGRDDAADVVGDVFLVAWRSRDRVKDGDERAWLFGVARRLMLAGHRQSAASTALERRLAAQSWGEASVDPLADDVVLQDQVHRTLNKLSGADRELLITATWFDLSPAEAAKVLGVSRPTYAVRLHRARNRFRTAFELLTHEPSASSAPGHNALIA
ncbi:RNA polymerase sigma factor [Micromonospora sp. NPDC092111]|uniref:RNA polymerase sigma factor n=1 Tax=Micromonospora sp. NPDC092111 TaxID=3364289 RepID=UPI00382D8691